MEIKLINLINAFKMPFQGNSALLESHVVEALVFDTRRLIRPEGSLFFALKSETNDGHNYIESAFEQGVRAFVVSTPPLHPNLLNDAVFILAESPLAFMQQIASWHREQFQIPIVGITGSNGKTVVKEWLSQLLDNEFNICRSPKSFNSQLGVAISVSLLDPDTTFAIFEAGISATNEMPKIATIIKPTIGIFTNLGEAHNSGFTDKVEKMSEKAQLFKTCEVIIYCKDQLLPHQILSKNYPDKQLIAWSLNDNFAKSIVQSLPFNDQASTENALHCAHLMKHLGYEKEVIIKRLSELKPVPLRLQISKALNGCTLINDSYNADLNALAIALEFASLQVNKSKNLVVILSDLLQTGQNKTQLYATVYSLFLRFNVSRFIGIGTAIETVETYWKPTDFEIEFHKTTEDFIQNFDFNSLRNQYILLKGARTFQFEHIAKRLELRIHRTILELDISAFNHNFNIWKSLLINHKTKIMGMVKASGYGSGSIEVAKILEQLGCNYLAVAYADEGVELRLAGINLPILVLNPEENTFDMMFRYQLEPEIYSLNQFKTLLKQLNGQTANIHLKLDTGMRRLGFEETDIQELVTLITRNPQLKVVSIFTHLAASGQPLHDTFTYQQIDLFNQIYQQIAQTLGYQPLKHVLNSDGIARFPQFQFDMVRLGIGLYGVTDVATVQTKLRYVSTLKTTIAQIKHLNKDETIGYNRAGNASHENTIIGTIRIGYADGYARQLGNGKAEVLVRNVRVPTIGNICMDMTMIDLSSVPDAQEGDEVILFGQNITVTELAQKLNTIPYEIFTMVSERVSRQVILD